MLKIYADDLAAVIPGIYLGTVADLMQGSLRAVNCWCKTKGLPIKAQSLGQATSMGRVGDYICAG